MINQLSLFFFLFKNEAAIVEDVGKVNMYRHKLQMNILSSVCNIPIFFINLISNILHLTHTVYNLMFSKKYIKQKQNIPYGHLLHQFY